MICANASQNTLRNEVVFPLSGRCSRGRNKQNKMETRSTPEGAKEAAYLCWYPLPYGCKQEGICGLRSFFYRFVILATCIITSDQNDTAATQTGTMETQRQYPRIFLESQYRRSHNMHVSKTLFAVTLEKIEKAYHIIYSATPVSIIS